jgi:hypothetical protein
MKNIDDLLKKAKPEVPDLLEDFSQKIISKINARGLYVRPQQTIGLATNWFNFVMGLLLLVFGLITANNAIFEVQMSGSLELLSFGTQYISDFISYLPLDIILPALLITAVSSWLLWRSHCIKRGITLIITGSFLVTSVGGSALAATSINRQIQETIIKEETEIPIISWFYKERARYHMHHANIQMGKVIEKNSDFILIEDPYGKTQKIVLSTARNIVKGQYIRMNGEPTENGFKASKMQHCNPMRVSKYFKFMGNSMPNKMHRNMMMPDNMGKKMMKQRNMMRRNSQ